MKLAYECLPCIVKQAIKAATMNTEDRELQDKIIKKCLKEISEVNFNETAPFLGRIINNHIKEELQIKDPYEDLKKKFNKFAIELCEDLELEKVIENSESPIDTASRLAIAGNIIDFSAHDYIEEKYVRETIEKCLNEKVVGITGKELLQYANKSRKILYLADNAGEIVFDKLLIKELPKEKITCVVKGKPIVNDATMTDAVEVGMMDLVRIIDNGSDAQGTILSLCSEEFKKEFEESDMVISKGQANYETLSDIKGKKIFFLFKAKCMPVARDAGCDQGNLVMKEIN